MTQQTFELNCDQARVELNAQLRKKLAFLGHLKDPETIVECQNAYEAIFDVSKVIASNSGTNPNDCLIDYQIFADERMDLVFGDLILYLYEIRESFDLSLANVTELKSNPSQSERCASIFSLVIYLSNLITCVNFNFKLLFQQSNGLKAMFKILETESFVLKYSSLELSPFNKWKMAMFDFIVMSLSTLSMDSQDYKHVWNNLNAIEILTKISK